MPALERELKTYQSHLSELLPQQGKFVVIHGDDVVGIYDSYADALAIGYEKFGASPFLVKRIEQVEQVASFTRELVMECRA